MHGEFQSERENIKLIIRLPEDLEFQSEEKKNSKLTKNINKILNTKSILNTFNLHWISFAFLLDKRIFLGIVHNILWCRNGHISSSWNR